MQEARQPPTTTADGRRGNLGIGQQGLRRRVFEQDIPVTPGFRLPRPSDGRVAYLLTKNGCPTTMSPCACPIFVELRRVPQRLGGCAKPEVARLSTTGDRKSGDFRYASGMR